MFHIAIWMIGFIVLVVAGLVWYLSVPVPPGLEHRTATWLGFTLMRTLDQMDILLTWLGLCDRFFILKKLNTKTKPLTPNLLTDVQTEDVEFDGVPVRIFTPKMVAKKSGRGGGIIHVHGGGWTVSTVDLYDGLCRKIAFDVGAVLVSIEYRLAPEHPFPVPYDDCLTATKYFLQNASQYEVDPHRVAIMGDSAGGNLSAAVSLVLRDEDFSPALKAQVLIYPITQVLDLNLPSYQQNANGPVLSTGMMSAFIAQYALGEAGTSRRVRQTIMQNKHVPAHIRIQLNDSKLSRSKLPAYCQLSDTKPLPDGDVNLWNKIKDSVQDQRFSPLLADDLSSLPAAFVFTAQYDVLRDEGIMYARRLQEAGNDVTWRHSRRGYHSMVGTMGIKQQSESRRCYDEILRFIKSQIQ